MKTIISRSRFGVKEKMKKNAAMKVHNVRLGLATNSSSTHSIVILDDGVKAKTDWDNSHYGWDHFTLADKKNKDMYLAHTLYASLYHIVGRDIAYSVARDWGSDGTKFDDYCAIDHQSVMALPLDWDAKGVDKKFFDDFKNFVARDDVAILGGNDNDDYGHPLLNNSSNTNHFGLPLETSNEHMVCRKDDTYDYWTIFNRQNGNKTRISFGKPEDFQVVRSEAPDLVDIKITDYCPFGCKFCYQDSTPQGKHAHMNVIKSVASALGQLKTFEVALGGGEPTLHPNFIEILEEFRSNNIVPNFTTKSTAWLDNKEQRAKILELAGAFAYSVENADQAQEILNKIEAHDIDLDRDWNNKKLVFHYVMGVGTEEDFKGVLNVAKQHGIPVTLLGYKTNGRGSAFSPKNNGKWLEHIAELKKSWSCPTIGIDTKLAQDCEQELKASGISDKLYHTEEGKFSAYIDAVNGLMGPSSYCPAEDMEMLVFNTNSWSDQNAQKVQSIFQSF